MKQKTSLKFNTHINRKGMMDDAFDLLFTVMIIVFAFLLIYGLLQEEGSDKKEIAQEYAIQANYAYDAVTNFRNTELKTEVFSRKEASETNTMRNLVASLSSKFPRDTNRNKQTIDNKNKEINSENNLEVNK